MKDECKILSGCEAAKNYCLIFFLPMKDINKRREVMLTALCHYLGEDSSQLISEYLVSVNFLIQCTKKNK